MHYEKGWATVLPDEWPSIRNRERRHTRARKPQGKRVTQVIDRLRSLGIQDRVGSLAVGKDADIVLFDGDPFEYTSHVLAVIVSGQATYQKK
jgi:cytosine/adenosine deaminase-related metal-dependent hydrolase